VLTEEKLRSIVPAKPYSRNTIKDVDWTQLQGGHRAIFIEKQLAIVKSILEGFPFAELNDIMDIALRYHEEARAFWIFEAMLSSSEVDAGRVAGWILRYPHLVFSLLRNRLDTNNSRLPVPFDIIRQHVIDAVILSTNDAPLAALAALERLSFDISELTFSQYCTLLWNASMVVRGRQTVQEALFVLYEQRKRVESSADDEHALRQALQIAFERAEEAFESCPCDEQGRPLKQREAPIRVRIHPRKPKTKKVTTAAEPADLDLPDVPNESAVNSLKLPLIVADIRVDKPSTARLHSHVRLAAASKPVKQTLLWRREILDGIVKLSFRGEIEIELFHFPPPEYAEMEWIMYDCGSTATTNAMMDAIKRLYTEKHEACSFYKVLTETGENNRVSTGEEQESGSVSVDGPGWEGFNASQKEAIQKSFTSDLSLIWGPPGEVWMTV